MLTEFVRVASVSDLPEDGMIDVQVDGNEYVLARVGDEYFALDGWCSHAAGLLAEGYLHADACEVECPVHEGFFDLRTGDVVAPPAEENVMAYDVRIEGDDILVGPKA
jgi:nitrite reductase/ring-hydroxylating ferredoxin subunit